jgi:hypothetical protein
VTFTLIMESKVIWRLSASAALFSTIDLCYKTKGIGLQKLDPTTMLMIEFLLEIELA